MTTRSSRLHAKRGGRSGTRILPSAASRSLLTAAQARAQAVPLRMLTPDEAQPWRLVAETFAIGARQAGIAAFRRSARSVVARLRAADTATSEVRRPTSTSMVRLGGIERASQGLFGRKYAQRYRGGSTRLWPAGCRRTRSEALGRAVAIVRLRHPAQ